MPGQDKLQALLAITRVLEEAGLHNVGLRDPEALVRRLEDGIAQQRDLDGGDGVVLVDHSRYGTWVNEERVAGRARLHAGARVRIGEPGIELALISVGGGGAQATPD